jgi:hypothetical protein
LLYSKAQFHALTSFVLPDPLIGRTGTEEVLHTFRLGYCQPWTSMGDSPASILRVIKRLSPGREYYPRDKRRLQTVIWDQQLMSVQHDSYESLVQEILAKSDRLRAFTAHNDEAIDFDIEIPSHLRRRSEIRRLLYERSISDSGGLTTGKDMVYKPRDRQATLPQATNVYQIVRLVRKQPFSIHMRREPESISSSLSDLIEGGVGEQWGSLVNLCRHTNAQDSYRLIFRLGLLSFGTKPDMDAIQSLAAFGKPYNRHPVLPLLSSLSASPTLESLINFIAADYPIFELYTKKSKKFKDLSQRSIGSCARPKGGV